MRGCRLRSPRRFGRESDLPRLQRQVHGGLDGGPGDPSGDEVTEPSAKVSPRDLTSTCRCRGFSDCIR
jgi:hypothetical protein